MNSRSATVALIFAGVGHFFAHLVMPLYPTVVLVMEGRWGMSYGDLPTAQSRRRSRLLCRRHFADGLTGLIDGGTRGAGGFVTLVFLVAATAQLAGGWLADRFAMKAVYILA